MEHEKGKYEDQITLFALGVLKGYELRQLEEHLGAGCEICEKVLRENELVLSSLAYSLDDSPLSPQVENKIFDRIEAQETAPAKSSPFSFWRNIQPIWLNLGSAIAVVLLIILFMNNMSLRNELSIQKQLDCSGKLLWETGSNDAILMVSNIPTIEEGKTYQFWVVENGEPHSMGTFLVGKDGHKMIEINCMPDHGGEMEFYVTLEPEGGMPHPTGATYLVGSL